MLFRCRQFYLRCTVRAWHKRASNFSCPETVCTLIKLHKTSSQCITVNYLRCPISNQSMTIIVPLMCYTALHPIEKINSVRHVRFIWINEFNKNNLCMLITMTRIRWKFHDICQYIPKVSTSQQPTSSS